MNDASPSGWSDALGRYWTIWLVLFGACLFAAGAMLPLSDVDLPIHLATGEWIVQHHTVPFVEPWAWTRAGAPFLAYSWAPETLYFLLFRTFGPIGLHVFQGLMYVGVAAGIAFLGYAAKWRPWTTISMSVIQIVVTIGLSPNVRPQTVLLIVTPIAWGLVLLARDARRVVPFLALLTLVSAIAANSHLLFPIVAAPCVLLVAEPPVDRKRLVAIPAAIALGWLLTPYSADWPAMFRLYFSPNALLTAPTPISEYKPGFASALSLGLSSVLIAIPFAMVPWVAATRYSVRARVLHGLLWIAGLLMFALAVRALVVWWLLILPVVGATLDEVPEPQLASVRLGQRAALVALFISLALAGVDDLGDPWLKAGSLEARTLPSDNARSIEPIAEWLDCSVNRAAGGRLLTTFTLGGYVPWRLPYLSESIDGRTFFPDSVARAETYSQPYQRRLPLPPWRTADLAIVPLHFRVAAVLDTAKGWHRIALTSHLDTQAYLIGLWVNDNWWTKAGLGPMPTHVLPLFHHPLGTPSPSSASCAR